MHVTSAIAVVDALVDAASLLRDGDSVWACGSVMHAFILSAWCMVHDAWYPAALAEPTHQTALL